MGTHKIVNREELFRMVWSMPISQLRHELGVSDVVIASACRRVRIPMPSKGYWLISAESRPAAPPLPMSRDIPAAVAFAPRMPKRPAFAAGPRERPEPAIVVPNVLRAPHRLLQWQPLRTYPWRAAGSHLNMIVTEGVLRRANRIMNAFIKTTEREGWIWSGEVGAPTVVTVDGVEMKIKIRELRVAKKVKNAPGNWREYTRTLEWTGDICISIDDWQAKGTQTKWRDTPKVRLETMLRKVVIGFREVALILKQVRERREAENQRRKAAWTEWEAVERERKEAERKQQALVAIASEWERVETLRRFLKVASGRLEHLPGNKRLPALEWLRWAQAQADTIDPLHGDWPWVVDRGGADSKKMDFD
jgi:hypothetical protein